jgi:predicted RNase H-like nuclease
MQDLAAAGYALSTTATTPGMLQSTVEVYPHPALLTLLNRNFRVPYKVGNSTRYWPGTTIFQRVQNLLVEFTAIEAALAQYFAGTNVPLPAAAPTTTLAYLKRFEDVLDAIVCAWIGTRYIARTIHTHGDSTAAIWTP